MEFSILVFQSASHLQKFIEKSGLYRGVGISQCQASDHILFSWRDETVDGDAWARYHSAGFEAVVGKWVPVWHDDKQGRDALMEECREKGARFVEAYWGKAKLIISDAFEAAG